jgi:hypothetical protein
MQHCTFGQLSLMLFFFCSKSPVSGVVARLRRALAVVLTSKL